MFSLLGSVLGNGRAGEHRRESMSAIDPLQENGIAYEPRQGDRPAAQAVCARGYYAPTIRQ
jgi:hypothetical protein